MGPVRPSARGASYDNVGVDADAKYRELLLEPLRKCADYVPKLGQAGIGLELESFTKLFGADPLYSWVGLDSPLMYAAHKAAGGMTSVYRQLGIGCERLFRGIIQDSFELSYEEVAWNYVVPRAGGGDQRLALDARIDLGHLGDPKAEARVGKWLDGMKEALDVKTEIRGAVFEVRQGYKSKDSKRQNADLANAANAFTQGYFPILAIMSLQLDADLKIRYQAAKWGVLVGSASSDDEYASTYAFANKVVGYDLAGFFERNSPLLREEMTKIFAALLEPK